jgi:hypothetical protein
MKMKNYFLILAAAALILSSCSGKMSAVAYNAELVQIQSEAWDYLSERTELIYDYENTSSEDAKALIDSINAKYDGYINRLSEMKYPDAAADLNKVAIQLYSYVKDSIIPLCSETLNYPPEGEEWYKVWNEIDDRLKGRADEIEDQMIEEQEKFAAAVGMALE